jgi:hypothetical protein
MFKYIIENRHTWSRNGSQRLFRFPNGFGASVVKHNFSYGCEEGLYELAVIAWNSESDWGLTYDTPVTNDVIGWLTPGEVVETLQAIHDLPLILAPEESASL